MSKRKIPTRTLTSIAMLVAISVILTRFVAPVNTDYLRFSLGNVPVVLCSILFGPFAGGVCGLVADTVGCFISGYPPYPLLMLSPVIVGVLPGITAELCPKGIRKIWVISLMMIITNFLSSQIVSTVALSSLYGNPVWVVFWERLPVNCVRTASEIIVIYLLMKSGIIFKLFGNKK